METISSLKVTKIGKIRCYKKIHVVMKFPFVFWGLCSHLNSIILALRHMYTDYYENRTCWIVWLDICNLYVKICRVAGPNLAHIFSVTCTVSLVLIQNIEELFREREYTTKNCLLNITYPLRQGHLYQPV